MSDIDKRGTDRERTPRTVEDQLVEYPPGVCGSCYWCRPKLQFGRMLNVCMCMPKQVIAVAQSTGAQVVGVNPVIDNLAEELCAMWKPLPGDTQ
jgi:hypothetical protein